MDFSIVSGLLSNKYFWVAIVLVIVAAVVRDFIGEDKTLIDYIERKFRMKKGEQWRSDRDMLAWLRGISPNDFEHYVADLFTKYGYRTRVVGGKSDGGIDVIATKDGVDHFIQCKKFITSKVPVGAVRDFYGAVADRPANGKAYFITTNVFTHEAEQFATDKPIELIDQFELIKMVRKSDISVGSESNKAILSEKCPECGGNLLRRKGKYGSFFGCSNYPKCKYTEKG